MADAIYDTPISNDVKVGVKIRGLTIDFQSKIILIDYTEIDGNEAVVERHIANIRIDGENPDATLEGFLGELTGDKVNSKAKAKKRLVRYMLDKGIIADATIQ